MEPEEDNARTGAIRRSGSRSVAQSYERGCAAARRVGHHIILASGNIEARPIALIAGTAATVGALDVVPAEPTTDAGAIVTYALGELITLILAVGGQLIEAVLPRLQ